MKITNEKLLFDISRRRFIGKTTLLAGALMLPTIGCLKDDDSPRNLRFATLDDALDELLALEASNGVEMYQPYSLYQVLNHCAQSIEYAMTGFPETEDLKYFDTIGSAAFDLFSEQGYVIHDLSGPVPSAPAIPADGDIAEGLTRLREAIYSLQNHIGVIHPHFKYGYLTKEETELANAMHIADHFSALVYV